MRLLENENVSKNIMKALKESSLKESNENYFETDGLEIAANVCLDNNSHCEETAKDVVSAALDRGIDCEVVKPLVLNGEDTNANHYAIKHEDNIIDYCLAQFLGDNKTVKAYILGKIANNAYAIDRNTLSPVNDISVDFDSSSVEELMNNDEIKAKYIIEII